MRRSLALVLMLQLISCVSPPAPVPNASPQPTPSPSPPIASLPIAHPSPSASSLGDHLRITVDPGLIATKYGREVQPHFRLTYDESRHPDLWWFEPQGDNLHPAQWVDPDDLLTLKRLGIDPTAGEFPDICPRTVFFSDEVHRTKHASGLLHLRNYDSALSAEILPLVDGEIVSRHTGHYLGKDVQVDPRYGRLRDLPQVLKKSTPAYAQPTGGRHLSSLNMARTWAIKAQLEATFADRCLALDFAYQDLLPRTPCLDCETGLIVIKDAQGEPIDQATLSATLQVDPCSYQTFPNGSRDLFDDVTGGYYLLLGSITDAPILITITTPDGRSVSRTIKIVLDRAGNPFANEFVFVL